MALIKCPECGKEVSDKAMSCPNCGLGIREYIEEENKKQQAATEVKRQETLNQAQLNYQKQIENIKLPNKPSKNKSIFGGIWCTLMALLGWFGVFNGFGFIWLLIAIIFSAAAIYSPKIYRDELKKYEQAVKNPNKYRRSVIEENERKVAEAKTAPQCPECGSTYISTVNRGYSIVWGFIGSGRAMNVCQKCGYKWNPGT